MLHGERLLNPKQRLLNHLKNQLQHVYPQKKVDADVLVALPYRVLISMMCTVNEKKILVMYLILILSPNFSQLIYSKN
jgi:hypothetical protein